MARTVTTRELYDEINAGTVPMILDVRNQDEFAAWQVEGTRPVETRNLPIWMAVEQIDDLVKEIPQDTIVVCAHGNGSDLLLDMLADEGKSCRSLEGGTAAWAELLVAKRLPTTPEGVVVWQVQRPAKACLSYAIGANTPLEDGVEIDLGDAKVHVLNIRTPGHTPGSTCINIPGRYLITGDTVFVRGIGRPDLTGRAEELATELFHTVHDRLQPLDPATIVLPAHWSFANEIDEEGLVQTPLGHIFESTLLSEADLAAFIEQIITSLPAAPDTYDTIRLVNSGRQEASAEQLEILEIGKNQCAASTTT